jgi:hypothetical protein
MTPVAVADTRTSIRSQPTTHDPPHRLHAASIDPAGTGAGRAVGSTRPRSEVREHELTMVWEEESVSSVWLSYTHTHTTHTPSTHTQCHPHLFWKRQWVQRDGPGQLGLRQSPPSPPLPRVALCFLEITVSVHHHPSQSKRFQFSQKSLKFLGSST